MRRHHQVIIRFNCHFVNENTFLVEYHVLMEILNQDFTILQKCRHVNTVLEIVTKCFFGTIGEIEDFHECCELIFPVDIVKPI